MLGLLRAVCPAIACTTASRFLERCASSRIRNSMCRSRALRSPMSRLIEEMPTSLPASSYIGATLTETSISRPSLWRRTHVGMHGRAGADAGIELVEGLRAASSGARMLTGWPMTSLGRVAEQARGRRVPGADDAVGRKADHGARRGRDDGGQMRLRAHPGIELLGGVAQDEGELVGLPQRRGDRRHRLALAERGAGAASACRSARPSAGRRRRPAAATATAAPTPDQRNKVQACRSCPSTTDSGAQVATRQPVSFER